MKINAFAEAGKTKPIQSQTNPTCRGGLSIVALAKMEASGEAGAIPTCRGVASGEAGAIPPPLRLLQLFAVGGRTEKIVFCNRLPR